MASCVFTREVWHRLLRTAGLQHLAPLGDSCMADWWQQTRAAIPKVFRKSFDSLVRLTTWNLWKERKRTFDSKARTPSQLFALILEEADS